MDRRQGELQPAKEGFWTLANAHTKAAKMYWQSSAAFILERKKSLKALKQYEALYRNTTSILNICI